MYKIIGANNAEYGPVPIETIRQWIAEGRINSQTLAQSQGETGWKPISQYPDFAASFASVPLPPVSLPPSLPGGPANPLPFATGAANPYARQTALDKINGPSIALIVAASLGIVMSFYSFIKAFLTSAIVSDEKFQQAFKSNPAFTPQMQETLLSFVKIWMFVGPAIVLITSLLILFGAIQMRKLSSYGLCMAAAVVAVIPCITPCCGILSIPFGIWALVVLCNADVKSQFN